MPTPSHPISLSKEGLVFRIDKLRELVGVQTADGNWNYDAYMHGMANGMILALSIMEGLEPQFLNAPDEWTCDHPREEVEEDLVGVSPPIRFPPGTKFPDVSSREGGPVRQSPAIPHEDL